jgi:hypothetical protein
MKLSKWSLYYQSPVVENLESFRETFAEANNLIYGPDFDDSLKELWEAVCAAHSKIKQANMSRWLPADVYFHMSALSTVWFFSLHLRQPILSDLDMRCMRYTLPVKRGRVKNQPQSMSAILYLTGVLPSDEDLLKRLFIGADISGNEVIIYLDEQ